MRHPVNNSANAVISVPIGTEHVTLLDVTSLSLLGGRKLTLDSNGYAVVRGYGRHSRRTGLHRLIANTPVGMQTDHINGNKLDNRAANLRVCTHQQNQFNKAAQVNNVSGYKGVSWNKWAGKWRASIGYNKKQIHLGYFDNKLDAAAAYVSAALAYHKEYAKYD